MPKITSGPRPSESYEDPINIESLLEFDGEGKCTNLSNIIFDVRTLMLAYEKIKSKPGNMVPGTDNETLDGLKKEWFEKISRELSNGSYKPKPARRILIPKPNGKLRPLGISSPRDKIVQQAIKLVLEIILEPKFSNSSHGFRPNRGCHTALQEIRKWPGAVWFIEGDIKGFFDNIDHHILADLLKDHINDTPFIHLYWKLVKAGYIDWNKNKNKTIAPEVGVPQGGIVSPILSNLVLDQLDKFVQSKINEMNKKCGNLSPYISNPKYVHLTHRARRLRQQLAICYDKDRQNQLRHCLQQRRKIKSTIPNPAVTKLKYVRYADDWVIGVWGPKKLATELKSQIKLFLNNLKLELSDEKTLITNARSDQAKFLGTNIKRIASNKIPTRSFWLKNKKLRTPQGNILMRAPIAKILTKLNQKKIISIVNKKFKALPLKMLSALPTRDIILRFNSMASGVFNYYSFVDNRGKLSLIYVLIRRSLIKTLKYKLKINQTEFLKKFGDKITLKFKIKSTIKSVQFIKPNFKKNPNKFLTNPPSGDLFERLNWEIRTVARFDRPCAVCNSKENVEMHHIKHIRTINANLSQFDKLAARINRKQIPLCHKCHREVHNGNYSGKSLKFL